MLDGFQAKTGSETVIGEVMGYRDHVRVSGCPCLVLLIGYFITPEVMKSYCHDVRMATG